MNSVRQFVSGCASSLLAGLLASLAYFRGFRFFSKILFHGEPVLRSYVARKKEELVRGHAARGHMAAELATRTADTVLARHQELLGTSTRVGPYPA
jgi:hypothetical protein